MSDDQVEVHSGDPRMAALGNDISDAIHKALIAGLDCDFVCSIMVGCAADYWLENYQRPVTVLAEILRKKAKAARTMPKAGHA